MGVGVGAGSSPRPLDVSAVIAYGHLVAAAYEMYDIPIGDPLLPAQPSSFPVAHEITAWIHMSDFALLGEKILTFYGFIARQTVAPFTHYIVIRGTEGLIEWFDDAVCYPVRFQAAVQAGQDVGLVHAGFERLYRTLVIVTSRPRAADDKKRWYRTPANPKASFADQVDDHIQSVPKVSDAAPERPRIVVIGHSLGGALCTLYAMEHCAKQKQRHVELDAVCTFGSPRVGLSGFVANYNAVVMCSSRIFNRPDIVPKVPFEWMGYRHVDVAHQIDSAHTTKWSPSCWHSMYTYLHTLQSTEPLERCCLP